MRFSSYMLVALLAAPLAARADAISPPPTTCVEGSMGVACHGPPRCAPADCTTDGECGAGRVCRATPLCIETVSCGGITTTMDPNVTGQCLTGHCALGGTCGTRMVCVASTAPIDDGMDSSAVPDMPSSDAPSADGGAMHASYGCCSAAGARGAAGGALAVLGALALVGVRRRAAA